MSQEDVEGKESLARTQLPYRAEYCKTSRAKCKKCSEPMEANSLKLANMVKSRWHDGYDANFYHVQCFFQIKRPESIAEISHFETLRYEDQKMLEKAVETKGLSVLGTSVPIDKNGKSKSGASKSGTEKKAKKRVNDATAAAGLLVNYDDFLVEYAKSNRSKCVSCEEKIEKDTVRLGKLDYNAETAFQAGPVPRWHHVDCFIKDMKKLEFFGSIDKIKNFQDLEKEDRKMLKSKIKPLDPAEIPQLDSKKVKSEPKSREELEEEKLLKKQSDKFYQLRENVNQIRRQDLETILEHMQQKYNFKSPAALIDAATDVLLFGPLSKCPQCKGRGGMVLRGGSYICTLGSESSPCNYETRDPKRSVPDIPDDIVEKYPFFSDKYRFGGGKRLFPTQFVKAVEQKEAEDNKIAMDDAPLDGLSIGVISWKGVQMDRDKVEKKVILLGAKVLTALDRSLFVILTSEDELKKDSPKVEVAKALGVPFVRADFLFNIKTKEDVVPQVTDNLIGSWDGNLESRFETYLQRAMK